MIIKELNLKNFGKFSGKSVSFTDGINVIYGPNEAGKTTMYYAIGALLFGLDKQRGRAAKTDTYSTYQPWENKTWYEGSLKFETGGKLFYLERNFYHNEKSARLVCETDGEELSVAQGDLEMLLGEMNAELFFNTAAVGQLKMKPKDIIYSYLKNYIASAQESRSNATDVVKVLGILENKKKALEQQKKKYALDVKEHLAKNEASLELLEKEIADCQSQLKTAMWEKQQLDVEKEKKVQGLLARFLYWFKMLFFGRRQRRETDAKKEKLLKIEEKISFLKELLGERESLQEELLLKKDFYFQKLHEQSKAEEIKAIEIAMERVRELSNLRKEEIMERLLAKASEALHRMTNGKYQKLLLEDGEEPCIWDGNRKLKLFQVSTGCGDQVYLALRIGLQDLFFEEDTLPLMFDDAFVYFDDKRLERLLFYLSGLDRQILLFSCHKRELRLLEKLEIPYGKIIL